MKLVWLIVVSPTMKLLHILFVFFGLSAMLAHAGDRPNVLFIAVDDLKPVLGAYGDPIAKTPNMDRIAAQGRVFDKAYCQYAVCAPSRASLMTGLRPDTTEVLDLKTHIRDTIPNVISMPQHFGQQGYNVAGIGKIYHGGNAKSQDNELSFFGNWVYTPGGRKRYFQPDNSAEEQRQLDAGKAFWNVRPSLTDRGPVDDYTYIDGNMTKKAVQMLQGLSAERKQSGEPFFLAVGYQKPHLPFTAPDKYWKMYDDVDFGYSDYRGSRQIPEGTEAWTGPHEGTELRAYDDYPKGGIKDPETARHLVHAYYACVSYVDALIGELLDELEAQGMAEDTIIVLWGDHGWHLGDHDGFWAKHSNFEQATRSPLLISYPGIPNPGATNENVVELVDIFPTLCQLTGLPLPNQPKGLELQGASLEGIMENPDAPWSNLAFSQFIGQRGVMGHSLRNERYRLTVWYERDDVMDEKTQTDKTVLIELYDYSEDPEETKNHAQDPAYRQIVEAMMAQLDAGFGWRKAP